MQPTLGVEIKIPCEVVAKLLFYDASVAVIDTEDNIIWKTQDISSTYKKEGEK